MDASNLTLSAAPAVKPPLALVTAVSTPIDVSSDGGLLLLFMPGLKGFELVNTQTGRRELVSSTPCTGYYATLSPDKRFVCFKDFQTVDGQRLQVPCLYEIARKKVIALAQPARLAGNPVMSNRGQIAYTLGENLMVLNPDLKKAMQLQLGEGINVLAFSPEGRRLAFGDAHEKISWLDLDTGQRVTLPFDRLHGSQPRFSPKGQSLLARSANGEVRGCTLDGSQARNFGRAETAAWLDEDRVALVRKDVANFSVRTTAVVKSRLSDGTSSILLAREGDAAMALNSSTLAFGAADGIGLADTQSGLARSSLVASRSAPAGVETPVITRTTSMAHPMFVVTNASTVQLTGVPYIHQDYDTADSFPGGDSCCNATATLMAIQYYGRLPIYPMTCTRGGTHTSYYGYYITSSYSYNGYTYNIPSSSCWGTTLAGYYGGFGYFLQDTTDDSLLHSTRLSQWVANNNLTSGTDDTATFSKAQAEINSNHPVVLLNSLTSAGHYITCMGYYKSQYTLLFNDPFGNQAVAYPGWAGAAVPYDWPGYNNGYPNLNTAWRYIYARGTGASPGMYWDLNGTTPGTGTAPSGTWDTTTANWSCDPNGAAATGPWAGHNAYFSAGTTATGSYNITISGTQPVEGLFVQSGTVTFNAGQLDFLSTGAYYTNYVAAGCTEILNTPLGGSGAPDKWGAGTAVYNSAAAVTGGAYCTLNQGTLAIGNNSALGPYQFILGDSTGANVVTFKSSSTSTYVISNYVIVSANNFILDTGGSLTFGGPINLGTVARTATVNNSSLFSGAVTNSGNLIKAGAGTLTLSGTTINTYGATVVSAGTLVLSKSAANSSIPVAGVTINAGAILQSAAANQINDSAPMTLAGGTWLTGGYNEQLGTLKLTASSTINFGSASVVKFAASSGVTWTGSTILSVVAWNGWANGGGASQLFVGTSSAGLTAAQLSQIQFIGPLGLSGNFSAKILTSGEIVPMFSPPSLSVQPQPQAAAAGANVTFTTVASGTRPLCYQWKSGGSIVTGATNSALTLTNVTQSGTYSAVVTNVAGTNTSAPAQLTVYATAAATLGLPAAPINGQFSFGISGVPGYSYVIQSSTNLVEWIPLQTNIAPFTFTDTNAGNPSEFYRAHYSR